MAAESLRDELMQLAGVADAEVDDGADSPTGVRVRLEPDADARLVGVEVQRVLASHGLRSRITDSGDDEALAAEPLEAATEPLEAATEPTEDEPAPVAELDDTAAEAAEPVPPDVPPPPPTPPPVAPAPGPAADAVQAGLASVGVEESADKVEVTATAGDGRIVTQPAEPTEDGLITAAVSAVGTLADGTPPELVSVTPIEAEGARALALVLRRNDGSLVAGAAVVRVGIGYAAGRATWTALREG